MMNSEMYEQQPAEPVLRQQEHERLEKLKKSVLTDIQRADDFFQNKVEPVFSIRRQLYEADKKHYERRFSTLSKQSDFVSYDLWSLVQWAIPSVMNSFFNGGDAIAIVGRSSEDCQRAEVFKNLIDFQVMVQNHGFIKLWDWFSDAFVYNLGAIKVTWERDEEMVEGFMEQVDQIKIIGLLQSGAQIIEQGEPDMFTGGLKYVRYVVPRVKTNRPRIDPVRVTELRWSPEARSLDEANFVAHRKLVSADYLRKNTVSRGGIYDDDAAEVAIEKGQADGVKVTSLEGELNPEFLSLRSGMADEDAARQLYELYECYVKVDLDGDGILEDAIVTVVGDEILRLEENPWERTPIFTISPIRDPYKVVADLSFAEIVGELQGLKIAIIRQLVINTANTNNQKFFVDESRVVISDFLDGKQFIRLTPGMADGTTPIIPFPQSGIAPWTMPFLEFIEGAGEKWTGQTRYNQGLDAKSLNHTATGISILTEQSEQRMDYIVRVFAETGVGEMMRFLVQLNQMYIDTAQVVRLNNTFLEVTPDDLQGEFDIDVNTEAGVGKKKQTIQNLQFYLSAIAPAGIQLGAVTPAHWAKAAQKLLLESGIRDPQEYVQDPQIMQQQLMMMLAQAAASEAGSKPPSAGGLSGGGEVNERRTAGNPHEAGGQRAAGGAGS